MTGHCRMSPLTAFFFGIFGVGAVVIAVVGGVVLFAMRIVDTKATSIIGLAENTVVNLPDLIDSLPPAVGELFNDRRAPEYASQIDIDVSLVPHKRSGGFRPALTITNNGKKVVSILAVRVAVLNERQELLREWTEVVATPIAIDNDWRGPLFPGKTRHVLLSSRRTVPADEVANLSVSSEISELRTWEPKDKS